MSEPLLNPETCQQARLSRDRRFDGMFFTGVLTTGIFCRPICPAPAPKPANVRYFRTAAAAFQAGLRPCLRCRPEAAPGSLAWNSVEPLLRAAVQMLDSGYLQLHSVTDLSDRLGISSRHLRRLFQQYLGTTPLAYARMQQTLFAKQLLTESQLPVTAIAMAAAFGSIRRFNDHFKNVYGRSPRELRKHLKQPAADRQVDGQAGGQAEGCELYLAYRQPYDFNGLLNFYAQRAVPAIEQVTANYYARTFEYRQTKGWFKVTDAPRRQALKINLYCNRYDQLQPVIQKIRQMLDTDTDPLTIQAQLGQDVALQSMLNRHPGLRIPGCWSLDEACARAILGQRVSVTASIAMLARLANEYGQALPAELSQASSHGLTQLFPSLARLAAVDAKQIRMGGIQASTLGRLADQEFTSHITASELYQQLTEVKGIGDWTAQYVLLRGLSFPDAWLAGDVVVQQQLAHLDVRDQQAVVAAWRPWRGYALLHLWQAAAESKHV